MSGTAGSTPRRIYSTRNFTMANGGGGGGPGSSCSSTTSLSSAGSVARFSVNDFNVPVSVLYDQQNRHIDHYNNMSTDFEFLEFVKNMESFLTAQKKQGKEVESTTIKKLKAEYESKLEVAEKKMTDFRVQFANKIKSIEKLEKEKGSSELKVKKSQNLIKSFLNNSSIGKDEKERLTHIFSILEGVEYNRVTGVGANTGNAIANRRNVNGNISPGNALDTITEDETTDLSMTQSEDDLDLSYGRGARRSAAAKRRSIELLDQQQQRHGKKLRKSGGGQDQIIARIDLTVPKSSSGTGGGETHTLHAVLDGGRGLITATSSSAAVGTSSRFVEASAPAASETSETDTETWQEIKPYDRRYNTRSSLTKPPELQYNESPLRFGRTLSTTSMALHPHSFVNKTVIKPETCEPCGRRIRFSKEALKCRECKACCHPECRDKVPLPCVSSSTPSRNKREGAHLADYCPSTHPMVPALIQHCVNEVEVRGSTTTGLYRVPGSEKEVHELKQRFFKGKGVPNLGNYDIHAICGCIKDFLRSSITEQLIGRWSWKEFALALEINDPYKRNNEILRTLNELPPPNQDTLAFLILHLQRVAEFPEVKMPTDNLVKIFGPTIIGYSKDNLSPAEMLKETKTQQHILDTLLSMSSEIWKQFLHRSNDVSITSNSGRAGTLRSSFRTNIGGTPVQNGAGPSGATGGKKIFFSDDSPNDGPNGAAAMKRQRSKKFFD